MGMAPSAHAAGPSSTKPCKTQHQTRRSGDSETRRGPDLFTSPCLPSPCLLVFCKAMSLFGAIQMGGNTLRAMQIGLQVVGNNIANANTPGYIRQEAIYTP